MADVTIVTKQDFTDFVEPLKNDPRFRQPLVWGVGYVSYGDSRPPEPAACSYYMPNGAGQNLGALAVYADAAGMFGDNDHFWREPEVVLDIDETMIDRVCTLFAPFTKHPAGHKNVEIALRVRDLVGDRKSGFRNSFFKLVLIFEDVPSRSFEAHALKMAAQQEALEGAESWTLERVDG